jgi:Flp pilus assembly protein TadG
MVAAPLLMLSLSVMGVAINAYSSNVIQDVAIEAARYGSLADVSLAEAKDLALTNLKTALGAHVDADVQIARSLKPCVTSVKISLRSIQVGLLFSSFGIEEGAVEVCENQF